jgi:hypothetical protein
MATSVPQPQDRRASRTARFTRTGPQRHADDRRRLLVSDTLAALRDGNGKRFPRGTRSMDAARTMLDRLRSR